MSGPSELRDTGWPSFLEISRHNCRFACDNWDIYYIYIKTRECGKNQTQEYLWLNSGHLNILADRNFLPWLSLFPLFPLTIKNQHYVSTVNPNHPESPYFNFFTLQEIQMKFMDGRIKLMNEILNGIKILKFYAWEKAFLEQVLGYREKELRALKKSQILYSISIASFNSSSFLVCSRVYN